MAGKMGDETASLQSLRGTSQNNISIAVDINNIKLLKNHITGLEVVSDIARMASLGLPHAGDWLNVIPSPALGLHLRPPEFITSVKHRLGMNIFLRRGPCTVQPIPSPVTPRGTMQCPAGTKERGSADTTI